MKLKDQVASPKPSIKLKNLGFPQDDSAFYWVEYLHEKTIGNYTLVPGDGLTPSMGEHIAAPTAEEAGKHLPNTVFSERYPTVLRIRKSLGGWIVSCTTHFEQGRTLVEAFVIMIIWLVERGYVDFKGGGK